MSLYDERLWLPHPGWQCSGLIPLVRFTLRDLEPTGPAHLRYDRTFVGSIDGSDRDPDSYRFGSVLEHGPTHPALAAFRASYLVLSHFRLVP